MSVATRTLMFVATENPAGVELASSPAETSESSEDETWRERRTKLLHEPVVAAESRVDEEPQPVTTRCITRSRTRNTTPDLPATVPPTSTTEAGPSAVAAAVPVKPARKQRKMNPNAKFITTNLMEDTYPWGTTQQAPEFRRIKQNLRLAPLTYEDPSIIDDGWLKVLKYTNLLGPYFATYSTFVYQDLCAWFVLSSRYEPGARQIILQRPDGSEYTLTVPELRMILQIDEAREVGTWTDRAQVEHREIEVHKPERYLTVTVVTSVKRGDTYSETVYWRKDNLTECVPFLCKIADEIIFCQGRGGKFTAKILHHVLSAVHGEPVDWALECMKGLGAEITHTRGKCTEKEKGAWTVYWGTLVTLIYYKLRDKLFRNYGQTNADAWNQWAFHADPAHAIERHTARDRAGKTLLPQKLILQLCLREEIRVEMNSPEREDERRRVLRDSPTRRPAQGITT
ncbi:hypothetical protein R1sor_022353 [Riccia sorocarpa]|uniref:Uncharacterized protein n=1 Tax=Riccia sorocarpa TaxID=122646 RepID=A0ABD3GJK9_9MARC